MASKQASFDIVSKIDDQEVKNAVNQADKELKNRFDLKGSKCDILIEENALVLVADDEIKLQAVDDILAPKLAKRGVPLEGIKKLPIDTAGGGTVRQRFELQQGIPTEQAREIVKLIKNTKLKVQAQIQDDQVRVMGKSRDDLQAVIKMLREAKLGIHMQFINFRD